MTEREKMLAGEAYNTTDPELQQLHHKAKRLMKEYNNLSSEDTEGRRRVLSDLVGHIGDRGWINQPFYVDYGCNISIGDNSIINMNCTFLDTNRIVIGNRTLIAPDVKIYTAYHPISGNERFDDHGNGTFSVRTMAAPVYIGDDTWIGGGAIIMPGVSIGNNVVIGAGSVVTKSIPDNVIAFGNPCRVVRKNL